MNIDAANSRIRVLRNQNNLSDAGHELLSHTIRTTIEEDPRKFKIDVGFNTDFDNKVDFEYYFNPVESVGVGTDGVGIGTTATIRNPGGGRSQVFLPTRSIRLPNHKFKTGDQVTYNRNTGNALGIATNRANADLDGFS